MASAAQSLPRRRPRKRMVSNKTGIRVRRYGLRSVAILYLTAMIVIPVIACMQKGFAEGLTSLKDAMATTGAWEAIRLTLVASALAAIINAILGTMIAFVLVRYEFRGRAALSAIVDLPLAIPTLVTGVMLLVLYGPASPVGAFLLDHGIKVAFAQLGVLLALLVVTLPFVVRTVQPVLSELDTAEEEAAATLGASPWRTFRKILFPALRPAITAGALLVFARCLGEYGSVVLLSGNLVGKTLTAPVFIADLTSNNQPAEAAAVATVMFAISFIVVLITTRLIRSKQESAEDDA